MPGKEIVRGENARMQMQQNSSTRIKNSPRRRVGSSCVSRQMLCDDGDVGAQSPLSQHESNVQADDARARRIERSTVSEWTAWTVRRVDGLTRR